MTDSQSTPSFFRRYRSQFIRLVICLVLLVIFGSIARTRISFNVDILDLMPQDIEEVEGMRHLYRHFSRDTELILTIESADPLLAEDAARGIAEALQDDHPDKVSAAIWQLPFEDEPELASELMAWLWLNAAPGAVAELKSRLSAENSPAALAESFDIVANGFIGEETIMTGYDPLGFGKLPGGLAGATGANADLFVSQDGTFRVIYVEALEDTNFPTYREVDDWLNSIRSVANTYLSENFTPEEIAAIEIGFTGEPGFVAEISKGMESDLESSMTFTAILIAILFYLMNLRGIPSATAPATPWWHPKSITHFIFVRLLPLHWLKLMLAVIFTATFAIGGLIFGQLSVMSIGFAAILMGLAVDYGVVLFRERGAAIAVDSKSSTLRRLIAPSIIWASATTAAVFVSLNFSSLPGIAELGTLVAVGVVAGALVMIFGYAPVSVETALETDEKPPFFLHGRGNGKYAKIVTIVLLLGGIATAVISGLPKMEENFRPFNLRESTAMDAFDRMNLKLAGVGEGSYPVVVAASTEEELSQMLQVAATRLADAQKAGFATAWSMPLALAPSPSNQHANSTTLDALRAEADRLTKEMDAAGFTEDATGLMLGVFKAWEGYAPAIDAAPEGETIRPQSALGRWLLNRAASCREGTCAAIGSVFPTEAGGLDHDSGKLKITKEVNGDGILVTGWDTLTPALHGLIQKDFTRVFLPMGLILVLMLIVVFRNVRDVVLSLAVMGLSALALLFFTTVFGIKWNFFNVTGLPILFGTGLDYAIHMIFALRRNNGELPPVRRGITKALIFCGLSTALGFGSLIFALSDGLASLGQICALGILLNMVAAIWLLPHWWRWWNGIKS